MVRYIYIYIGIILVYSLSQSAVFGSGEEVLLTFTATPVTISPLEAREEAVERLVGFEVELLGAQILGGF